MFDQRRGCDKSVGVGAASQAQASRQWISTGGRLMRIELNRELAQKSAVFQFRIENPQRPWQVPMKPGAAFGATLYRDYVRSDATRCNVDNQII
jgi:hypothetical protein